MHHLAINISLFLIVVSSISGNNLWKLKIDSMDVLFSASGGGISPHEVTLVALISTPRAALAKYLQMSAGAVFHFRSWEDVVS